MAVNRLFTKKNRRRTPKVATVCVPENGHEAVEVSLCDEGMCFCSNVQHAVGAVLLVDFDPEATGNDIPLQNEAVVVDCSPSTCGQSYNITVLFTGN